MLPSSVRYASTLRHWLYALLKSIVIPEVLLFYRWTQDTPNEDETPEILVIVTEEDHKICEISDGVASQV